MDMGSNGCFRLFVSDEGCCCFCCCCFCCCCCSSMVIHILSVSSGLISSPHASQNFSELTTLHPQLLQNLFFCVCSPAVKVVPVPRLEVFGSEGSFQPPSRAGSRSRSREEAAFTSLGSSAVPRPIGCITVYHPKYITGG